MKFDYKAILLTVVVAFVGITLINRFIVPILPAGVKKLITG